MMIKNKRSNKFLFIIDIVSIFLLFFLLYVISDLIDFFPWGNSQRDGLVLLMVPFIYFPLFTIILIIKFKIHNGLTESLIKSHYLGIPLGFIILILSTRFLSNEISTILLFLFVLFTAIWKIVIMWREKFKPENGSGLSVSGKAKEED